MPHVDHQIDARVEQIDHLLFGRRPRTLPTGIRIIASFDRPIPRHQCRHAIHQVAGVHKALVIDQAQAWPTCPVGEDSLFEGDCLVDQRGHLVGRVHGPPPHGQGWNVMHAVEIDRVLLVLLAVNFAEILGMKTVLAPFQSSNEPSFRATSA